MQGSDASIEVTGLLDWQGACVRPRLENFTIPRTFISREESLQYVAFEMQTGRVTSLNAEALSKLASDEADKAKLERERCIIMFYYTLYVKHLLTKKDASLVLYEALLPVARIEVARNLLLWSFHCWEEGLPEFFCGILPAIGHYIDATGKRPVSVPDSFNEETHTAELYAVRFPERLKEAIVSRISEKHGISLLEDAEVSEEDYDCAKKEMEELRQEELLAEAETEGERSLLEKSWPFQEGKLSVSAESCM